MPLRFLCPNCHRELEVPDEAAGTAGSCRLCGAAIIAPAGPEQPAVLAQVAGAPPPVSGGPVTAQAPYGRVEPFSILSQSWNLLWANFGPVAISYYVPAVAMTIVMAIIIGPFIFGAMSAATPGAPPQMPFTVNLLVLAAFVALSPFMAGPLYVVDDLLTTGEAEASGMFRGLRQYKDIALFMLVFYFVPSAIIQLISQPLAGSHHLASLALVQLVNLAVMGFLAATILPGIMEIVDRGATAVEACQASWEFTKGHRWMVFLAFLVMYIASLAGAIVCGIGVLITAPLFPVGIVLIYRDIRGLRGAPGR
jgi:hypothetical protein